MFSINFEVIKGINMKLLLGNEAFARGAYEAGATVAVAYPGTPSTEILENVAAKYKDDIYCQWSPNEKVALEVGAGAAQTGARVLVTMKHVGLNVAADPLMTLAYTGVAGGLVIIVADDPGMHSSQNEQDSRNYAYFSKLPMLEPSSPAEAKEFVKIGMELSHKYNTPVLVRSETRISHSKGPVELNDRIAPPTEIGFVKNPQQYVTIPLWARKMRVQLEEKLGKMRQASNESPELNKIEWAEESLGIITCGISYAYVKEVWPQASVLKLGWINPFPDKLIRDFAAGVDQLLVVEEMDDLLEMRVKAMGIDCIGRDVIPGIGELTPAVLRMCKAKIEGGDYEPKTTVEQAKDLPGRPPVLCPGCPHRGVFSVLSKQRDLVVTGDIGCYSLGSLPPLSSLDTILCMGGGFTMAHGMDKAGAKHKVVGIMGDSTFFHSGITGLIDIAYNKGASTLIVVDNRTTAMTGHQDHPGTGKTLMGEPTIEASIEAIGKACGIKRVFTVNPYDLKETTEIISREIDTPEVSLIVSKAVCPLAVREPVGEKKCIDAEKCKNCGVCLKLGCPAIERGEKGEKPKINTLLCSGCGLCEQSCNFGAITVEKEL